MRSSSGYECAKTVHAGYPAINGRLRDMGLGAAATYASYTPPPVVQYQPTPYVPPPYVPVPSPAPYRPRQQYIPAPVIPNYNPYTRTYSGATFR
jgi:hypothetical protein